MPSILIWRQGALGDTVLLLPALAALRAACPAHHIVACGRVASLRSGDPERLSRPRRERETSRQAPQRPKAGQAEGRAATAGDVPDRHS